MSTTIRVSKRTKDLLTKVLIKLENELGRRLDYDEVIRILVERSGIRNPELLLRLKEMSVSREIVEEAHKLLEETRFEERVFERRYGSRHKYSS
ncbi:MAG: hypothetical protein DRO40_01810 [Thermoprotei archaeon]|nr:MAG: hypothetical protein DRO40_01810 [Thermoprotei archaeon]